MVLICVLCCTACPKVRNRVLELIASDPGAQQAELVLLGLFGRAVRLIAASAGGAPPAELTELSSEAESLVSLLRDRHAQLCVSLENPDGGFPELRSSVWQAPGPAQAAVQTLLPQMTENRRKVGHAVECPRKQSRQCLPSHCSFCPCYGRVAGVERFLPRVQQAWYWYALLSQLLL